EFAQVRGVRVKVLHFVLIGLIALSVVMVIQVVGLILIIALLTIPSYIAERHSGSLLQMMVYAVILNILFTTVGLWLSYAFNLTSGAVIIMVAAVVFFCSLLVERLKFRRIDS
ncbi:MAG: metal ABC transporter permease, partial [Pseudomonadota bacterium]